MSLFILESPVLAGLIFFLLLVIGVELFLRIRYRELLWLHIYPQVYVPDEDLGYRYRADSEGEIRIPGIHRRFRTNNKGFHARDFVKTKTEGTFRIALVGTSNTTGIWMNGSGKNFSELLEARLLADGRQVEVMNFGIDGRFRAIHEMRILDTDVAEYNPDLVLIDVDIPFVHGIFMRDVYKNHVMIYNPETEYSRKWCEHWVDAVSKHRLLPALYRISYIVRAAARVYMNKSKDSKAWLVRVFVENRIQAPDVVVLPYSLKRSVEALCDMRDKFSKQRCRFVIFQYFPNSYYQYVMNKYELQYLELNVPPIPKYVHDLDGHYRYEGHEEVARQMYEQLTRGGFLELPKQEDQQIPVSQSSANSI